MEGVPPWPTAEHLAVVFRKHGRKCLYVTVPYHFRSFTLRADIFGSCSGLANLKVPNVDKRVSEQWLLKELCIGLVRVAGLFPRSHNTVNMDGDGQWRADRLDPVVPPGIRGAPTPATNPPTPYRAAPAYPCSEEASFLASGQPVSLC